MNSIEYSLKNSKGNAWSFNTNSADFFGTITNNTANNIYLTQINSYLGSGKGKFKKNN